MARLSIEEILNRIDRPVDPRPEFSAALLEDLVEQLERPAKEERIPARVRFPRLRRPLWAAASVALVVIVAVIASVVMTVIPEPATAQAVIREAIGNIRSVPAFRAEVFYDRNPEGSDYLDIPEGAKARVAISYPGPDRRGFRQEVLEEDPLETGHLLMGGPGSFLVWDGEQLGQYRADDNEFVIPLEPAPDFDPLSGLTWNAPYPNWEDVCRRGGSEVLPEARIAGRAAQHIRCGDAVGGFWELWIDRDTGLMLKILGQLSQDDYRFGTSSEGSFEVTSLEYGAEFQAEEFRVEAPPGASQPNASALDALARVPAFTAEFAVEIRGRLLGEVTGPSKHRFTIQRVWYREEDAWRKEIVQETRPQHGPQYAGGPGSFSVWNGKDMGVYTAQDNTYYVAGTVSPEFNPAFDLVPQLGKWLYLPLSEEMRFDVYVRRECTRRGIDPIAGRRARHLRCLTPRGEQELWLDSDTGLLLRADSATVTFEVRSIDYSPVFPPDTFSFIPPPGAGSLEEVEADPYANVDLRPGQTAPSWTEPLLGGGSLRLEDLRGRPTLIMFFGDWCPPGDAACEVLPQFQTAFEQWSSRAHLVWVDIFGSTEEATRIVEVGDYTFPVVFDETGDIAKSWGVDSLPLYVLLNHEGEVVEVRLRPQSLADLNDMLSKA